MAFDIWKFLWYFMLASFCGWLSEVAYNAIVHKKFKNPGMLNGPYCPQYGLMIALPWAVLTALHLEHGVVATLFFCLLSSVLVEFLFAWVLRRTIKLRLRDYSGFKWNFRGYICVPLALLRGVIFTPILMFVVPVVGLLLNYVNRTVGWVILGVFLGILLLDIVITIITIAKLSHQFKRLAELGAMVREARDALGSAVTEKTLDAAEAIDDLDLDEKLLKAQESAEESYTALLNKSNFFKRRFLSASPDMTSEQYEKELDAYRITTAERKKRRAEREARNLYEYEATFENPEDRPFAFGMNLTKLFWIFLIGCVVGFVLEECWAFFIAHTIELRVGLVYGPFQPIYGGGAAIITLCLYKLYKQNSVVIFIASGIIGAAFEYLCSWGQEMVFGTVSWDYSDTPFNIDGRTNLMFALIWGTLGLIWLKSLYPAISRWIEKIPKRIGGMLTVVLAAFMIFDAFISCAALIRADERSRGIPATSSFQQFLDRNLDDDYLALVYPNMQKVNDDGTKSAPLKDIDFSGTAEDLQSAENE